MPYSSGFLIADTKMLDVACAICGRHVRQRVTIRVPLRGWFAITRFVLAFLVTLCVLTEVNIHPIFAVYDTCVMPFFTRLSGRYDWRYAHRKRKHYIGD